METDGYYYFNRCRRCYRMITKLEVVKAMQTDGIICPCGGGTFGPTNPRWWEIWLTARGLKMVVWQLMGRLAPAPEPETVTPMLFPADLPTVAALSPEEIRAPEEDE